MRLRHALDKAVTAVVFVLLALAALLVVLTGLFLTYQTLTGGIA